MITAQSTGKAYTTRTRADMCERRSLEVPSRQLRRILVLVEGPVKRSEGS